MLYKFRNFTEGKAKERTLEIIRNCELYFASIQSFNDPFDGQAYLNFEGSIKEVRAGLIRSQYVQKLLDKKYERSSFDETTKLITEKVTSDFLEDHQNRSDRLHRIQELHNSKGVLSLSSKNNNILMWSHYTYNHQGLCFGFEFEKEPYIKAKKVRYQSHYEDISAWLFTDEEIVERILFTKAIDWGYEDEYRIITSNPGAIPFKRSALKEIVFGSKMSNEDQQKIINECLKKGLNPKFKKAQLDVVTYQLNIIEYKQ